MQLFRPISEEKFFAPKCTAWENVNIRLKQKSGMYVYAVHLARKDFVYAGTSTVNIFERFTDLGTPYTFSDFLKLFFWKHFNMQFFHNQTH